MNISYNKMNCDLDSDLQRTQKGEIFSCTIACTWAVTHLSGQGLHLSHSNNFIPQEKGYTFLVFQLFWINFFLKAKSRIASDRSSYVVILQCINHSSKENWCPENFSWNDIVWLHKIRLQLRFSLKDKKVG